MKRLLLSLSILVLAATLCAPVHAAQGGGRRQDPIAFILQHASDLSITDDQKTKIEAIQKDLPTRPKDRTDQNAMTEYRTKVKDAAEKVTALLTKDQQDKLTALKDKAAAGSTPADKKDPNAK
ncbi:MAG TPA: hypothetical protein VKX17_12910 [Planctomycetota bacterium]|nr:hypothetical protein [Planctomycetota bacterium]